MARIEELIRQVKKSDVSDDVKRASIAELNRRDAARAIGKVKVAAPAVTKTWHDALLETSVGKKMIEAKVTQEGVADRIRQLKELVHDVFVVMPRYAEPVNGWVPRIRFDVYQASKEACRKLGQVGGAEYGRVITRVKYALNSSKDYRDAIEALGL